MKSIFRYPGGKSKKSICEWILKHKPKKIKSYREPMVGGGGIFFEMHGEIWINDMNEGLIEVYKALKERGSEFIKACRKIDPQKNDEELTSKGSRGGKPKNKRMFAEFNFMKLNSECDQALRYYYINRTCFGGRVNYDIPSRLYFSHPPGWNIVKTNLLEKAVDHLKDVKITCGSYKPLLYEPGEDVWIYLDPPYCVNTNLSRTSQLYQHNFTNKQHEELAEDVKNCKHNIALSYDDNEFIRNLYKDFTFIESNWKYCGSSLKEKKDGLEVLILNY